MGNRRERYLLLHRNAVAFASLVALVGCGSSRQTLKLPLEPIAYVDTLPIERPQARNVNQTSRLLSTAIGGEIGYAFSLRRLVGARHESVNITRFDDVVNSAWFEHRIDAPGGMSPEQVARGPTSVGPDTSRTLTVIEGRAAGISPKFTVRDARGTIYIVKFDPKGNLHLASAAGVIASRLMHAAGYYTPSDYIVVFDSARLVLDPGAEIPEGRKLRKMTEDDVLNELSRTDPLPDGRFLAIASEFVPGQPLDALLFTGVRGDDPNDYYLHQHRRELRGLYVLSSWLNHVDMRYENTLDVFIDPPGYVRHYLFDFAASLGSGTIRPHIPREGEEYNFALWPTLGRVFTLGFYEDGWEDVEFEQYHPSIGWMPVETFNPGGWRANWPNVAFRSVTPADGYWGAKLVAAFSDEHIRAAVAEGDLPVQMAADRLAAILQIRRDKVVEYWYRQVTPVENAEARIAAGDPARLEVSFDDLGLDAGVFEPAETTYRWEFEDVYFGIKSKGTEAARSSGRQAVSIDLGEGFDTSLRGVDEDEATSRLRIEVGRDVNWVGRSAELLLRWEGASAGYRVVGLRH